MLEYKAEQKPFIHFFFLTYVSGIVVSTGTKAVKKGDENLYPCGVFILAGRWVETIMSNK